MANLDNSKTCKLIVGVASWHEAIISKASITNALKAPEALLLELQPASAAGKQQWQNMPAVCAQI